jgi:thiol-disulfide isomerase/thioredoxin
LTPQAISSKPFRVKKIAAFIGFLGIALAALAAEKDQPPTLSLGSPAPDFKLPGVDGKMYRLKNFSGARLLVVVFTCNHCPTAQAYEERLKKIVTDYKPKGVAVVAISPNDPKSLRLDELGYTDMGDSLMEMKVRAHDKEFNFPYLYDGETEDASKKYGPVATPHAFVFDKNRRLCYVGRIDDNEREELVKSNDLRNALDDLLAKRPVKVPQTKVFGCSTKWAGKQESVKKFMEKVAEEPVAVESIDAAGLEALRKNDSGKLRLVNFWATWCEPCVTEFPELVIINRMYRKRDFEFVTVAANYPDEKRKVLDFLQKQQASNKNFLFGENDKFKMMTAFDPNWQGGLPYTVLLSPKGQVLYHKQGEIDPLELRRIILDAIGRLK